MGDSLQPGCKINRGGKKVCLSSEVLRSPKGFGTARAQGVRVMFSCDR